MGRVYLAKGSRPERMVALKALSPAFTASPSYRERFEREANAAAALNHPGICTIHILEEFDGELFIVTKERERATIYRVAGPLLSGRRHTLARLVTLELPEMKGPGITDAAVTPDGE